MVCCPEEIAYNLGYINSESLRKLAQTMKGNAYGQYLLSVSQHPKVEIR